MSVARKCDRCGKFYEKNSVHWFYDDVDDIAHGVSLIGIIRLGDRNMNIRRKTVKIDAKDEEIRKLQEQVLQLHRDKTALMGRCKTLSRGLACSFCNFRCECVYVDHSKDGDVNV